MQLTSEFHIMEIPWKFHVYNVDSRGVGGICNGAWIPWWHSRLRLPRTGKWQIVVVVGGCHHKQTVTCLKQWPASLSVMQSYGTILLAIPCRLMKPRVFLGYRPMFSWFIQYMITTVIAELYHVWPAQVPRVVVLCHIVGHVFTVHSLTWALHRSTACLCVLATF